MDLHLHSMASADWKEPGATWLDWLYKCEQRGLDVVAITDHNTVAGIASLRAEIERLQWLEIENRLRPNERRQLDEYRRLGEKILVLPGFEFTATFGFHIIGLFPPETSVRQLEHILLDLNVPPDRLDGGSTEVGATADVLTAYRIIHAAGGIVIAAHANSTHGVAMRDFPFGGQTKISYTQDAHLHALEVTDLGSRSTRATARFFNGSKPEYPRRMHCIQGSDAHRINRDLNDKNRLGIGDRVTEIQLTGPVSFTAIKKVFESNDFAQTRPLRRRKEPFDHVTEARQQGPSIIQSFHERATRQGGRLYAVLSDVVAFANTQGGTVYVGASTHAGPPRGVDDPDEMIVMLREEIESKVVPPLAVEIDSLESQGQNVLRIQVPPGIERPYCLDDSRIYLRQESDSVLAVRDEIVQLVRRSLLESGDIIEAPQHEAAAERSTSKRKRGSRRSTGADKSAEAAQEDELAEAAATPDSSVEQAEEEPGAQANGVDGVAPPTIGVQVVEVKERGGTRYYTIRDLRNGSTVQNVTLKSARRLWRYAISQHEQNPPDAQKIEWQDDVALLRSEKRAGKRRYDFVQRFPDSSMAVYYGVTEEGCDEPWRSFLVGADAE
ncbi:MAG: putative DNA binding domain-containing protein [Caldilineae bacterium]|nr:putative DNA binding domain-containing protein [Caldilineae bacterium]